MSFLEPRLGFPSNFASLFSVMRHNSSVLFHLNFHMLWTKEAHQSANFQVFDISHENQPNTYFSSHESFSFKFCITFQCHNIFSLKFSSWNIIRFWQKNPINVHFFTFECTNNSSPDSSCHFWKHKLRVYSNFTSLLRAMKDYSSVLF